MKEKNYGIFFILSEIKIFLKKEETVEVNFVQEAVFTEITGFV